MSPSSPSQSTDSRVGTTRRHTLEDDKTIPSRHSTIPNGDSVVGTEYDGPMDLSISAQLPTTNDSGGLKRRIMNDGEDLENQGLLDLTQNVEKKKRTLVVTLEPPEKKPSTPHRKFCRWF